MPTTIRKQTLLERSNARVPSTRGIGEQLIPVSDDYYARGRGSIGRFWNRTSYDGQSDNQLSLYDNFKLSVIKKKHPSELQDMIAKNGTVSAAMDAYTSVCSTALEIIPGEDDGVDLWRPLLENAKFKRTIDQIFEMMFRRGGCVVELMLEKVNSTYLPTLFKVHDPKRFDFEEMPDGMYKDGDKWGLALSRRNFWGDTQNDLLDSPLVEYIAWRPKAGDKPFGRSRISASTYYTVVLVNTLQLIVDILSKSGSPVLPITIDKQKLFGGQDNMEHLFPGDDIEAYVAQQAQELRKVVPALGEGDALILTGECVLGEYLSPTNGMSLEFLDAWQNQLRLDILQSMNVPPAQVGIVQKSGSLNDHNTKVLIRDFKNNGHQDQLLVADHLQPILTYAARVNDLRLPTPVRPVFAFSNPEEIDLAIETRSKRSTALKNVIEAITNARLKGIIDEERAQELFETEYAALDMTRM